MADIYTVVAPLALIRRTNGTREDCYFGSPVPQDAVPGEVERLEAEGYIVRDAVIAVPAGGVLPVAVDGDGQPLDRAAAVAADPGLLNVAPSPVATLADKLTDDDLVIPPAGRPRGNASEAAWRDYHAAQLAAAGTGADTAQATAAGMSRDDIRALYP